MTLTTIPKRAPREGPTNPLRSMRLGMHLSLDQLARKAGVSRQLIIRAEQAVYADPPPRLISWLSNSAPVEDLGLEDIRVVYHLYHDFQTHTRKSNYGRLDPKFNFSNVPAGVHPFVDWRLRSGVKARIGTAKFFCVHPALLHKYEVQPHLVQSTPGDLHAALLESGYSSELLASLEASFHTYKRTLSDQFKAAQVEHPDPLHSH